MDGVIMFPHQTNLRVVTKSPVLQFSGLQGPRGMSGSYLVIPARVRNEGTGTLRKVNTCREGDATGTREFLENAHGFVQQITPARNSNPPSEVEVSVGDVAWSPTLLGDGLTIRLNRFGITTTIPEALSSLVVDCCALGKRNPF